MQATRLKAIRRRVTVPEKVLKEFHMVRSEAWEVMADLVRIASGTPIFSQPPDRGYKWAESIITEEKVGAGGMGSWRRRRRARKARRVYPEEGGLTVSADFGSLTT